MVSNKHCLLKLFSLILIFFFLAKQSIKIEKNNSFRYVHFLFSKHFGNLSLISLKGLFFSLESILTQKRIGVVSITRLSMGPMRILCIMSKSRILFIRRPHGIVVKVANL